MILAHSTDGWLDFVGHPSPTDLFSCSLSNFCSVDGHVWVIAIVKVFSCFVRLVYIVLMCISENVSLILGCAKCIPQYLTRTALWVMPKLCCVVVKQLSLSSYLSTIAGATLMNSFNPLCAVDECIDSFCRSALKLPFQQFPYRRADY